MISNILTFNLTEQTAKNAVGADAVCIFLLMMMLIVPYYKSLPVSTSVSLHCVVRDLIMLDLKAAAELGSP